MLSDKAKPLESEPPAEPSIENNSDKENAAAPNNLPKMPRGPSDDTVPPGLGIGAKPIEEHGSPQSKVDDAPGTNKPPPAPSNLVLDPPKDFGEKWILEAERLSGEGIAAELRHLAAARTRWKRFIDNIKDLGPPVTGVASAVIAGLVLFYGNQFNRRQIATQESDLQLKILSEFSKSLADLSAPDEKTRTLAAIRLVQYEGDALPSIKPALGVAEDAVRKGAVTVVAQLYQSEVVPRDELLKSLLDYFRTRNSYMRIGVLECFIELDRRLSWDEASKVTSLLARELKPADCSRQEEEEVLRQAAVFLGLWPSLESANLLLGIAKNRTCLRARIQAVDNLPKVAQALKPENRKSIVDDLQAFVPDDPETLKQRIEFAVDSIKRMGMQ